MEITTRRNGGIDAHTLLGMQLIPQIDGLLQCRQPANVVMRHQPQLQLPFLGGVDGGHKSSLPGATIDVPFARQIGERPPHRRATDTMPLAQLHFRGQPIAWAQLAHFNQLLEVARQLIIDWDR